MKTTRLCSVAALVFTCAASIACFAGPACGCDEAGATPYYDEDPESVGANDQTLEACEPVMWDIDAPLENSATLVVYPALTVVEGAEVEVTLTAADRSEVYVLVSGVAPAESIEIFVHPGEAIGVAFVATADFLVLDWEFEFIGAADLDPLVTAIEPDVELPDACL